MSMGLTLLLNLENKFFLSCKGLWDAENYILLPVQLYHLSGH